MTFESLKDKTVLVTGGARGIGKGLAKASLQEGARVIITNLDAETGKNTQEELSSLGAVRSVSCDATDRAAVDRLMDDIWANEGPVDIVFCNAGRGGNERVLDASIDAVRDLFATNFESAIHIAQSYIPRVLSENKPGHVMFTGSEHSVGLPEGNESLGFAFYGSTKHALLILAEWLRTDLIDTPVSVSLLMPGPVLTEGVAATFKLLDEDPDNPGVRAQFSKEVEKLLRERIITTEECAKIALAGLRKGLFYIPTQTYIKQDIDRRYREMVDAFRILNS
jgi:NAD(P)-dependent dehydrogenase (short-subunit alcohol dehydrogenase family)